MKKKLSREVRLAYLCHLLHQRMLRGRATRITVVRHYFLVIELERERINLSLYPVTGAA